MTDELLKQADKLEERADAAHRIIDAQEGVTAVIDAQTKLIQQLFTKVREQEWQPIATAPKDGTDILISMYNIRGEYQGQNIAGWSKWDEDGYETEPHWAVTCGKYGGGGLSYVDSTFSQWKRVVEPPKPIQAKSLRKK